MIKIRNVSQGIVFSDVTRHTHTSILHIGSTTANAPVFVDPCLQRSRKSLHVLTIVFDLNLDNVAIHVYVQ